MRGSEELKIESLGVGKKKKIILLEKAFETTMDVDYVTPAMNQSEAAAARADNLYIRFSVRRIKPQQLLPGEEWQARATNLMTETRAGEGTKKQQKKREEE